MIFPSGLLGAFAQAPYTRKIIWFWRGIDQLVIRPFFQASWALEWDLLFPVVEEALVVVVRWVEEEPSTLPLQVEVLSWLMVQETSLVEWSDR